MASERVIVVGAGIGGLVAALELAVGTREKLERLPVGWWHYVRGLDISITTNGMLLDKLARPLAAALCSMILWSLRDATR